MAYQRFILALAFAALAPRLSMAQPPGFVDLAAADPSIVQDIRYAGSNNFTGRPVQGYAKAACWLRRETATALAAAQAEAVEMGLTLIVYDCYRPRRATQAFLRWASDATDQVAKASFYPTVDKRTLFAWGYIAGQSSHSTGLAVDIGMRRADGAPLDFGTPFDRFDARSATYNAAIVGAAREHRRTLVALMTHQGFENYAKEWWHFSLRGAASAPTFDEEIR
jgi:D-alanyl-D-alanine dipeptidase